MIGALSCAHAVNIKTHLSSSMSKPPSTGRLIVDGSSNCEPLAHCAGIVRGLRIRMSFLVTDVAALRWELEVFASLRLAERFYPAPHCLTDIKVPKSPPSEQALAAPT